MHSPFELLKVELKKYARLLSKYWMICADTPDPTFVSRRTHRRYSNPIIRNANARHILGIQLLFLLQRDQKTKLQESFTSEENFSHLFWRCMLYSNSTLTNVPNFSSISLILSNSSRLLSVPDNRLLMSPLSRACCL